MNELQNPEMIMPSLDRKELLALVAEHNAGAEFQDNFLYYPEHNLRVKLEFGQMKQVKNYFHVQLLFILQHPWFDEDFIESCAGIGTSPDKALTSGVANFCGKNILELVLKSLTLNSTEMITANIMNELHEFFVPEYRPVQHGGKDSKSTDLWEIIKHKIPEYLGTKRCYWIKLTSAKFQETTTCEVSINNIKYQDLTDLLYQEALKNPEFRVDNQFLLLIQKEETYTPCPFEKQDVGELAFMALDKMTAITDKTTQQKIFHEIKTLCPDSSIATELIAFLPEIVAQAVLNFRDNDSLIPVINYGKPEFKFKKSQVRSYGYMQDAVEQYLRKMQPSKEELLNIVKISSKFEVLTRALGENVPIQELRMSELVYFVDKNYHIW